MKTNSKQLKQRKGQQLHSKQVHFGEAVYFPDSLELFLNNILCVLPPIPAKVLEYLIENTERAVSRFEIIEEVWSNPAVVTKENFYQTIKRLRHYLGDTNSPREYIINSRTNYYVLKPQVKIIEIPKLQAKKVNDDEL